METYPTRSLPITAWAEDDRPREKLQSKGRPQNFIVPCTFELCIQKISELSSGEGD